MKFLIITINYGDIKSTRLLIKSIEKIVGKHEVKLFIGDNGSTDKSNFHLNKLKEKSYLDIELCFYKKNYFYWPAAKKIFDKYINEFNEPPDWTIVCNNDIIFNDNNFFDNLSIIKSKDFDVIGPNIMNKENKNLNPFMKSPMSKIKNLYWKVYYKSFALSLVLNFLKKLVPSQQLLKNINKVDKVYAVHGSIVVFSKFFFKKGGYFDINFNLFCEELTTAEIARKIGANVFYVPELKVLHNEHTSTKKINKKELFKFARESHFYFNKKYLNN